MSTLPSHIIELAYHFQFVYFGNSLNSTTDSPIIVLGAGSAGLCAARTLALDGHKVIVIERETMPGGLCRTFEKDGYRFDLGGHRFIAEDSEIAKAVGEMLAEDMLEPTRRSMILLGGKRYRYPLEPVDLARNLDPKLAIRGFADYARQQLINRFGPPVGDSFESWAVSRFGRTFYDLFFGPYTEKLWGIHPSNLAGDWASQRISLLNLTDVMLRLAKLRKSSVRTYARRYNYPREGIGQIFRLMADDLQKRGVTLCLGESVVGFGRHGNRVVEVEVQDGSGTTRSIPCAGVVSSLALPDASRMLFPEQAPIINAADRLGFRGVRFLNIMLDRDDVSENTWMYVADPRYLATRIQEPKRRSPQSAPEGKTSLMLEIPCEVGGDIWNQTDEDLLDRCLHDLDDLDIPISNDVCGYFSTRITQGYPEFRLGYTRDRDKLLAALDELDNVETCGRQGTYRYIFMDTAMQMGVLAAQQLVAKVPVQDGVNHRHLHSSPSLRETAFRTA